MFLSSILVYSFSQFFFVFFFRLLNNWRCCCTFLTKNVQNLPDNFLFFQCSFCFSLCYYVFVCPFVFIFASYNSLPNQKTICSVQSTLRFQNAPFSFYAKHIKSIESTLSFSQRFPPSGKILQQSSAHATNRRAGDVFDCSVFESL